MPIQKSLKYYGMHLVTALIVICSTKTIFIFSLDKTFLSKKYLV